MVVLLVSDKSCTFFSYAINMYILHLRYKGVHFLELDYI